jgi:hypothetical protein
LYTYLANANFIFIHTINLSNKLIKILQKVQLGFLTNFDETEVYLTAPEAAELAHMNQDNLSPRLVNPTCFKTVLLNGITVYSNNKMIEALAEVINHHDIWTDNKEFANMSKKE